MFEKIILRKSDRGPAITIGELAEALLFYQNIHIVLDYASLKNILSIIGVPSLLALLARPNVSAVYCEQGLGVNTAIMGTVKAHSFIAYTFVGTQEVGTLNSRKKILEHIFEQFGHSRRATNKYVERFRLLVPTRKFTSDHFIPGGVLNAAWGDILDQNFVNGCIRHSLLNLGDLKNLPSSFEFRIRPNSPNFTVDTNIDFNALNKEMKARSSDASEITEASLIEPVLSARADTALASFYGGEFYTSKLNSEIVCLRHRELLKRIGIEISDISTFQAMVLPESRSIREVINSGERTFDEFLRLLDKSNKFKQWIRGVNPDEKLVSEYIKEITSESWINKLPVKTLRYVIGALVGAVEPITGLGVSAADSFLLEKILGGWRANHFVENRLKPFVEEK